MSINHNPYLPTVTNLENNPCIQTVIQTTTQNLIICLLAHCQPSLKISCKSVWQFLCKVAQTDKQTNNDDNISSLAEVNMIIKKQNKSVISLIHNAHTVPVCTTEMLSTPYLLHCSIHAWFISKCDKAEATALFCHRIHHQAKVPYCPTFFEKWYQLIFQDILWYLAAKHLSFKRQFHHSAFHCKQCVQLSQDIWCWPVKRQLCDSRCVHYSKTHAISLSAVSTDTSVKTVEFDILHSRRNNPII